MKESAGLIFLHSYEISKTGFKVFKKKLKVDRQRVSFFFKGFGNYFWTV